MDTGPIIILANDQKCCYYQSSIQYIARIITTILHHNRDTTVIEGDTEVILCPYSTCDKKLNSGLPEAILFVQDIPTAACVSGNGFV